MRSVGNACGTARQIKNRFHLNSALTESTNDKRALRRTCEEEEEEEEEKEKKKRRRALRRTEEEEEEEEKVK